MAKANLPVNFKDDILKENMNGKRRFNMIQNSDGTVSFDDVTDYTQVGSTFGAAQINATNKAVNDAADASKIIDNLDTIKANTEAGYIAGALAVKELNSNLVKGTNKYSDINSFSANVGEFYFVNSVYTSLQSQNNWTGATIIEFVKGPKTSGTNVDSVGIIIKATATTVKANSNFGVISLK